MFVGPCIINIFQYISNKMQLYAVYLYLETAQFPDINCVKLHLVGNTGCPTTYQTRHFFNNSKTNEDIATRFEQENVRCVGNVTTS